MSHDNYDKVKHLVEVDDDILAVFMVRSGTENRIENLRIADNANITESAVTDIFAKMQHNLNLKKDIDTDDVLGALRWTINETDRIRTLIIYEKDRTVIVLIRSNTSLSESVDNILGYYYEFEKPVKALF